MELRCGGLTNPAGLHDVVAVACLPLDIHRPARGAMRFDGPAEYDFGEILDNTNRWSQP